MGGGQSKRKEERGKEGGMGEGPSQEALTHQLPSSMKPAAIVWFCPLQYFATLHKCRCRKLRNSILFISIPT